MQMQILRSYIPTALLLLLASIICGMSSCVHVPIADFEECSPIPNVVSDTPPDFGAACDQFLKSNQQILTHDQWVATQRAWISHGNGVNCIPSGALADLKKEIEKLCSVAKCDYATKLIILSGIQRMQQTAALVSP